MRMVRAILVFLVLICASTSLLSGTFARYTSRLDGTDEALVAKWNFNVAQFNGSFALIDASELMPQASGNKTFTVSNGGSDTAIDFNVKMNVDEFKGLGGSYPPLIFRVTVPEGVTQPAGTTGWFALDDTGITGDFIIAEGSFPEATESSYTISVDWWWNTSFYQTPTNSLPSDDTDTLPDYYEKATTHYNIAVSDLNNAIYNEELYATHYILYPEQTLTDAEGNVTIIPAYYAWDSPDYTTEGYQALEAITESYRTAVSGHTKNLYDSYDTAAMAALAGAPNMPKVGFTANGMQVLPE